MSLFPLGLSNGKFLIWGSLSTKSCHVEISIQLAIENILKTLHNYAVNEYFSRSDYITKHVKLKSISKVECYYGFLF